MLDSKTGFHVKLIITNSYCPDILIHIFDPNKKRHQKCSCFFNGTRLGGFGGSPGGSRWLWLLGSQTGFSASIRPVGTVAVCGTRP